MILAALAIALAAGPGAARDHVAAHGPAVLRELAEFVALPNVASDLDAIRKNASHLEAMLARRGIASRRLEVEGAPPSVFGEIRVPGATRTIVLYAHYDGQPADPAEWATPPWTPTLKDGAKEIPLPKDGDPIDGEWRLFGRAASDDKAPIVAILAAIDALRAANVPLRSNVKLFFEGEEEAGSPHLRAILEKHRDLLAADAWLFCDGPVHPTRRMQVVYGVRGVVPLGLTVYGPDRALHSGHYGNVAPNPAAALAHLIASLRAPDGTIRVKGYIDDVRPVTDAERRAIAALPPLDPAREFSFAALEGGDSNPMEAIMRPALNVDGLLAGGVGENAANAVPHAARAAIDFRLVPDQKPERVRALVEAHLAGIGWHVVHAEPDAAARRAHARIVRLDWGDGGYAAVRTPLDLPIARGLVRAIESALGAPPLEVPMLGGSLPLAHFAEATSAPLFIVPIVNHDNSQHAPNENLRLQNLWDGIATYAAILAADLGAAAPEK